MSPKERFSSRRRVYSLPPRKGSEPAELSRRRRPTCHLFPSLWTWVGSHRQCRALFAFDVVADIVTFLENLPGDITDESGKRGEEKFAFVHEVDKLCRERRFASGRVDDGIVGRR